MAPLTQAAKEAACEKMFSELYSLLARVEDSLSQTKGEIYIWHGYGHYIFIPGVHWFPVKGRWAVPQTHMKQLITCLRRVARMLWTLLLDFQEGFDEVRKKRPHRYFDTQNVLIYVFRFTQGPCFLLEHDLATQSAHPHCQTKIHAVHLLILQFKHQGGSLNTVDCVRVLLLLVGHG